jgi:hypothetical protein
MTTKYNLNGIPSSIDFKLHVVYINSCGPEDGRWTNETCRHIEFYNDIPVIRAYIVVLCLTVYIAPSDCITQRMENTKIKKKKNLFIKR